MKLLSISLENFQGIKSASFNFEGKSASIYGNNATGKTTIFNAFTWLLFDKASTGAKDFKPKTQGPNGELHNLNHAADAVFLMEEGYKLCLKKCFHEVYVKRSGSTSETFTGHTVDYYIDGVPTSEGEYKKKILDMCGGDIERMKMLTNVFYFPETMGWADRRKVLIDICGDISDGDIIGITPDLKDLPDYLLKEGTIAQYYTVEEYGKIAKAKKAVINDRIKVLPAIIDEAIKAIPDTAGLNAAAIDKQIAALSKDKGDKETEKAQAVSGDLTAVAIRNQISELNATIAEAKNAYVDNNNKVNSDNYNEMFTVRKEQNDIKNSLQKTKDELYTAQSELTRVNNLRTKLYDEYIAVQAETWDENKSICPTCNRALPDEDVQKLQEAFNVRKSNTLSEIHAKGTKEANKDMVAALETKIADLTKMITAYEQSILEYDQKHAELQKNIKTAVPYEETEEHHEFMTQLNNLRDDGNNHSLVTNTVISGLTANIAQIDAKIKDLESQKYSLTYAASQNARVEQLKAEEKDLSEKYEKLDYGIRLCNLFIEAKVKLLTDNINKKFKNIKFRLFVPLIKDGYLQEACDVMIPEPENNRDVPFAFANNGARINAGLEIIDVLSKHWGMSPVVFIDNIESVTHPRKIDGQLIGLSVSEHDKVLRMETEA